MYYGQGDGAYFVGRAAVLGVSAGVADRAVWLEEAVGGKSSVEGRVAYL